MRVSEPDINGMNVECMVRTNDWGEEWIPPKGTRGSSNTSYRDSQINKGMSFCGWCYSCPVLCDDKLSRGCALVRHWAYSYVSPWWSSQGVVWVVTALICVMNWRKELDIFIRCRNRLKRTCRVRHEQWVEVVYCLLLLLTFTKAHSYCVGCGCSFYRRPSERGACLEHRLDPSC